MLKDKGLIAAAVIAVLALLLAVLPSPRSARDLAVMPEEPRSTPAPASVAEPAPAPETVASASTPAEIEAVAVGIVPHSAIYKMRLGSARGSSGLAAADGRMIYRFSDACQGWVAENQSYITFRYHEGREIESAWNFSSWEAKDGLSYRFSLHQTTNGQVGEEIEGRATLDHPGGPGRAILTKPEAMEIELPAGTLLPTAHMLALLAAAERGESGFARSLFDGASLDSPHLVNALILPGAEAAGFGPEVDGGADVAPARSWNVILAYFTRGGQEPEPDFEMTIDYRADGIARRVIQNLGDMTLVGELEKLEPDPDPGCR